MNMNRLKHLCLGGLTSSALLCSAWAIQLEYIDIQGHKDTTKILKDNAIEAWEFYERENWTSITIPEGIEIIGWHAFDGCLNLKTIKIPSSVKTIEAFAFWGCTSLQTIYAPYALVPQLRNQQYLSANIQVIDDALDPAIQSDLRENMDCPKVELPPQQSNETKLKMSLHRKIQVDLQDKTQVTQADIEPYKNNLLYVSIPSTATKIGDGAFANCSRLTEVTIFNDKTTLGQRAFDGCTNLKTVYAPENISDTLLKADTEKPIAGCLFIKSTALHLTDFCIRVKKVLPPFKPVKEVLPQLKRVKEVLPQLKIDLIEEEIDFKTLVTQAEPRAYIEFYKETLETITIPNRVTGIGDSAFANCTSLTTITIPNSVTRIGKNAFQNCTSLKEITIPSVERINKEAFENCANLEKIIIPDSVKTIGMWAFAGCTSLKEIVFSKNIEKIAVGAFANCVSLEEISIPNSLPVISQYLFLDCENLTKITIPASVKIITSGAFSGCSGLKEITIPNTVEHIGVLWKDTYWLYPNESPYYATDDTHLFDDCINLQTVNAPARFIKQLKADEFIKQLESDKLRPAGITFNVTDANDTEEQPSQE